MGNEYDQTHPGLVWSDGVARLRGGSSGGGRANEDCSLHVALITGLSGAGKSEAIATFEDSEYFCIDNLPPQMLSRVVELFTLEGSRVDKVALVFDARGGQFFTHLDEALAFLRESCIGFRLVFLEASNEVLINRFQFSRRPHPLSRSSLIEGIERERKLLAGLRSQADLVIDTSDLSPRALRRHLEEILFADELKDQLLLSLVSFGYKYGLPDDADMVLDARFLPNPHWVAGLRPFTGLDDPVRRYVMDCEEARIFLDQIDALVRFLAPRFLAEQKKRLLLAIGCTGGRHRSVALTQELGARLGGDAGLVISISHRDITKGG